jgi:hypothetical protein
MNAIYGFYKPCEGYDVFDEVYVLCAEHAPKLSYETKLIENSDAACDHCAYLAERNLKFV